MEEQEKSLEETEDGCSPERDTKSRMIRELKSLQDSAKESKIISESTQLSSKIRKSRKDLDSPASRPNSVASNSPQNSDKSDDKRRMRTQNSEFAAKHMMFLKNATGAKKTVIATDSMSDSSQEKLTENDSQLMMDSNTSATMSQENRRNLSVVREVNGRRVDPFCWRCHSDGTTVQCSACPRSYHNKCINSKLLPQNMACWACFECSTTMNAEDIGKRTPAMEKISQTKLGTLLKFATQRMIDVKGSEPFTHPVDPVEFPDYEQYIVHPVDLEILHTKVLKNCFFGSTSAFLSETKWIVHNSIVFNTRQSKLSSIAKTILKVCKGEMGEIESCPECYLNAHTKTDWFIQVCERPHTLLWAKLKSYPYWPGKAMAVSSQGFVDVRFFGAHDRAWVPVRDCYLYSVRDPNSSSKPKKNEILKSVMEVNLHIENIRSKYRMFIYANYKTPFDPSMEDEQLKMMIPMYNGPIKSYSRVKQAREGKPHIDVANVNMQPKVVINKQVMRVENSHILKKPPVPALLRTKSIDSGLSCGDGSQISICRSAVSHGYRSEDDSMEEADIISRAFEVDEFSEVEKPILSRKRPRILSMNSTVVSKKMKPILIQSFDAGKSQDSSADRSSMMSEYKDALRESKTSEAAEKKISNQNASPAKLSKTLQNVTEVKVSHAKESNSERNVSTFKVYPGTTKATYRKTQGSDDSNEIAQKKARLDSLATFNNLKMNNNSLVIQHKSANSETASVNTVSKESPDKPDINQQSLITPKSLTAAATNMAATTNNGNAYGENEDVDELIVPKEEPLDPEDIPDEGVTNTPIVETQHQLLNSLQLMPTPMPEFISANIKELTVRKTIIQDAVQPVTKKVTAISELNPSNLNKTTVVNGNSSNLKESIVKNAELPIGTRELTIKKTKSSIGTRELTVNKGLNKKYKSPAELRDEGIIKTINESQSNITVKLVSSGSVKMNSIYPIDIRSLMEPPKEDNPSNVSPSKSSGQSFLGMSLSKDAVVTSDKRNAALIDEAIATISDEALQSVCGDVLSASGGNKTPSHEITLLNHQLAASPNHENNSNRRIRGVSTKRKKKRFASIPVPDLAPLSNISTNSASVSENNTANTVATNTEPLDNSADCLNPFNGIPSGMDFLPPSSAGPVHKLVNDNAFKMAAFFRQMIVSTLSDLGLKQGLSAEAAVRAMQMELELLKYNQQQFYKDIKTITEARIEEMRSIFESQTKRAVNEAKQIAELEKEAAVTNTKLYQWCAYCHNRSQFFCCWNTSYCSYQCQQNHWVSHTGFCVQTPKNGTQDPKNHGVLTATSPLPSVTNYTVREATPTSSAANDKTVSVDLEGNVVLARKIAANHVPQTSKNSPMLQILEKIPRGSAQKLKPVFISRVNVVNKGNKVMTAITGNSTMVSLPKQIITNAVGSKVIPRKLIKIVPRPAQFTSVQKKLLSPARESPSTSIQTSCLLVTKVNSQKGDSPPQVSTKDSSEPVAIITNNNDTSCLKPATETDDNHKDVEM